MIRVSPGRLIVGAGLAILIGLAVARLSLVAQQLPGPREIEATPVQFAACLASGAAEIARSRGTGAMRFVGMNAGAALAHPRQHDARTPIETAARGYLEVCGSLFGLSGDPAELELTRATTRNRRSIVRFQQLYGGVPVLGGELVVHLDADRNVVATSGHILPRTRVATRSRVTAAQATRTAVDEIARAHDIDSQDLSASAPRLWIYSESLLGPGVGPPQLVWRIEVASRSLQPVRELVLVDAIRGNIALHFNQIETALQRQTLTAGNTLSLPGVVVCDESSPSCAGDAHAEAAHTFAGDTYDFFAAYHGRDGITGTGALIRSTVHYGSNYANAFWTGSQVVYGDLYGFPLADDVVAHELTHGITQHTSSLFNINQSGAIGESLADLWGELVDQTNGRGNDEAGVRWLIGEDIAGLGAIRSMSDPASFGHPDRMTSPMYQVGDENNGGIHVNSGVNNKAASLMVDGGVFNGQTVVPLGIEKTAKIYYEAQTNLLTSGADYEDLFHALFQACNNLVGTSGIVVNDCAEVRNATLAVEMDRAPMPDVTLDARVCTAGEPLRVFFDDLENGSASFSAIAGAGTNRWSYDSPYSEFARSGQHALYADDSPAGVGDSSVAMTASVTVPDNAFLHFAHAYGFDQPNYDGGVVEYSVDEGVSWVDAGSLFDHGGYSGAIIGGGANPLAGRPAFIGSSHGWTTSRLDLSSLAGQRVRFRWRLGLDSIGVGSGWWIDDIEIFSCPDIPSSSGAPLSPSPADGATGVPTNSVLAWSATGSVDSYDIAFGTVTPPPQVVTGHRSVSYRPALSPGTTYYWRITVHETSGAVDEGPVWSFTTSTAPVSDLVALDTFTGTGALTSHTPDVNVAGTPWVVTGGPPIPSLSGDVVGISSGSGHVQATLQVGISDIRMGVDYTVGAGPQRLAGLAFRLTDVNNHMLLVFYENALHFYRRQNGVDTLLASSAALPPPAAGSAHRIDVETAGNVLIGYWDRVQVVQAADSFQQTATRHGLDWNTSFDSAATFDWFEIRGTAPPVVPPGVPANPSPSDGAGGVAVGVALTWLATSATNYDVAFGTSNPPASVATNLTTASYTPVLIANTTYYWQVTARNSNGSATGPIWSFTTGAAPADLLVTDAFTGSGAITSHAPDFNPSGAPWIVTGGPPTPTLSSGEVGITSGTGHVQATLQTGVADIRMGVDYRVGASSQRLAGLAFRLTDVNNHLLLLFNDNALHFYRRQAGAYTLLASSAPLPAVAGGSIQRMEVRTSSSTLTGWWNGVQVVQTVSSFQQTATRHGLDWNAGFDSSTAFDNLEIRSTAGPPPPPTAPTLPSPVSGATGVSTDATLFWGGTNAISYDLAFGTVNPPPAAASGLTSATYTPALVTDTTYYWQVTARNAGGSTTGPVWSFTTGAPNIVLGSPPNGATNVPLNTILQWGAGGSSDLDFGTVNPPPTVATNVTGGSYTPTLTYSTTYYWRVTARNAAGTTVSPIWSFTTASVGSDVLVADTFTGTGPITGHVPDFNVAGSAWTVTGGTPTPALTGGVVGISAGSGHVQATLQTNAPDIRLSADYRVGASSNRLAGLVFRLADANNHLMLIFYDNQLRFYTKENGSVTQLPLLGALPFPSPAAGSTHRLEVRTSGTMLTGWWDGVQVAETISPFQQTATRHGLLWNSAFDTEATFDNLEIGNNSTVVSPPSAPGVPNPANGATGVATTTLLTWSSNGATTYDLEFGTANPPTTVATNLTSASYIPALTVNTTYFWRVTARNAIGSTTGPVWSFTTSALATDLLVRDSFTGSGLLALHSPDVNVMGSALWAVSGGSGMPTLSDGLVGITAGSGHVQATQNAGVADIRMLVDYRVGASLQRLAGLTFRFADVGNHLLLLFNENALHFYRRQGGAYTLLASSAPLSPPAGGSIHQIEVRTSGSTLTGFWDGAQVVHAVDSFQQTATRHGLDWNAGYDPAAAFDIFEIRNNGAPLSPPSAPSNPIPAAFAIDVAITATLSWTATNAASYDVAFGTANPPPIVSSGQTDAAYAPAMVGNTTYYWQVTAQNPVGATAGPIWSFTTAAPPADLLASDTFTGSGPLALHAPNFNLSGSPWTVHGSPPEPTVNGTATITGGTGHVQATLLTAARDIRMSVDYVAGASPQRLAALVFRFQDVNNHLLLVFNEQRLHLYEKYDGLYTRLASSALLPAVASGSRQRMEVRSSGFTLFGFWNGAQVVQATDAHGFNGIRHGLDWNTGYDPAATYDNFEIRNNGILLTPPAAPASPAPADGETGVAPLVPLTWSAAGATTYDVAFGTANPPPSAATNLTSATYRPALAPNTTYFWRVTARNEIGSTTGPIWSFSTGAAPSDLLAMDTFTGPTGTDVYNHAPDVNVPGASWGMTGATIVPSRLNNGAIEHPQGTGHVQATLLMGVPDVRMSVDYIAGSSAQPMAGLVFRQYDHDHHLLLLFFQNTLQIYRRLFNTYTLLASSAALPPVTPGSIHRLEGRTSGNTLSGWWDGVQVVQANDSFIAGPRYGLDWNPAVDPTATFDNLEIRNNGSLPLPPGVPAAPNPADGLTGVATSLPLQWSAPTGALVYDVAFGTAMPLPLAVTGYVPGIPSSPAVNIPMDANTTYFWQVIAKNAGGATVGPVWTFTTGSGSCSDADNDRLCDPYETGTGIYVSPTNTGTSPLLADTDGDGLLDGDEVLGTPSGLNLPAMGTNPNRKNILLEYDWIDDDDEPGSCGPHSHRPTAAALNRLAAAFAAAPVSNPDGTTGITLIQDYGQGGAFTGGNFVNHAGTIVGSLSTDFYAIKSASFTSTRSGYFHYVVMAHWYSSNPGSSGIAELFGDDLIVSLGCFGSTENVANTIMHELGHNLGLHHGGSEACNWKPNYNSVMNYRFQFPGVDLSCNAIGSFGEVNTLDYSRGTRIALNELNLNEAAGVCGGSPIDWNFNGFLESGISFDVNRTSSFPGPSTPVDNASCSAALTTLTDFNDWANLYYGGISDVDGASLFRPTVDCNNPLMPRVVPEEWRIR